MTKTSEMALVDFGNAVVSGLTASNRTAPGPSFVPGETRSALELVGGSDYTAIGAVSCD